MYSAWYRTRLNSKDFFQDAETIYAGGACTLPRNQWAQTFRSHQNYSPAASIYSRGTAPIRLPSLQVQDEEPLEQVSCEEQRIITVKKESTVWRT